MSESAQNPQPPAQPLVVNIQYVKDLSFEVPNAPACTAPCAPSPGVNINLDVQRPPPPGRPGRVRGDAADQGRGDRAAAPGANGAQPEPAVFIVELAYAGVFTLAGVPADSVEPVLLVECPRLLFPYARNILADVTRDGGFPPVLLQPIDFVALWQTRRAQATATA